MTDLYTAVVLAAPTNTTRVLHLYGPKRDRLEALAEARLTLLTPHRVRHHWRPWDGTPVIRNHIEIPRPPMSRWSKAGHIAVLAAAVFALAVVVYNVGVSGA